MDKTKADKHCIMCDMVYFRKENLWLPLECYAEMQLGYYDDGIYHKSCLDQYVQLTYDCRFPDKDREEIIKALEDRMESEL